MRSAFICVVIALFFCSCQTKVVVAGDLLIKNANVVDVASGNIRYLQNIVIKGNRIIHIDGNPSQYQYQVEKSINATNNFIIPGLWDMHAHPDDPEMWRMKPAEKDKELLLPLFVLNGVTGIRDMGGDIALIKRWREKDENGKLIAPEIFAGGPLLDGPNPMWEGSVGIKSPEDVPKVVDSLVAQGVDFLKVYSLLPRNTYLALSAYANKIHYPFVGHVPYTVLPSEAARTGMKSQEHLLEILKECSAKPSEKFLKSLESIDNRIDRSNAINAFRLSTFNEKKADSLYDLFVQKKIWQCPTLSMWFKNAWYEAALAGDAALLEFLPDYLREYWTPEINDHLQFRDNKEYIETKRKLYALYLRMVRRMHEKGVLLLAGTDMGANPLCFPGTGIHNELVAFVKAGLTPAEALKTATINPAEFFEITNDYGTVEAGKYADLVLLNQNPMADITHIKDIQGVIRKGILYTAEDIERIKNEIKKAQRN